ncbi:DNA polymerase I [Mycoplasma putrefaciens]|uniref:DNA polymerase I n=1 Tax=Mycoplasma putrefaciens (strain ATCC 15718 / NCTC 10155 / C30 KS-1 / KS-1) TaxID=743965 RepID=A0A7U4E990_MYCPK|nr:DNA polymerase I [Mycoplasma putrefaciens]AEM68592.1 DNA polymerase I [Mycoplasma putrefaciens KS1]
MKKILIIDGNSLIFRAYYATAYSTNQNLQTTTGIPTNAVFSFINMLISVLSSRGSYDHLFVAFDKGKKTFRHEMLQEYKAGRQQTPDDLIKQLPIVREFLTSANIQWFEQEGVEADDLVGTIVKLAEKQFDDVKIEILSSDKDMYQLISDKTICIVPKQGVSILDEIDKNQLFDLWNIKPHQVVDFKAIVGDSSDNLKGVSGIGPKGACKLLLDFESLENIYHNLALISPAIRKKLENDQQIAFLCKQLATIKTDVEIRDFEFKKIELNLANIKKFLNHYEMRSLHNKFNFISDNDLDKEPVQEQYNLQIIKNWSKEYEDKQNFVYVETLEENYHQGEIIGIAISNTKGNFYLDFKKQAQQLSIFDDQINNGIDQSLENFFKNDQLEKITYDIKRTTYLLKNAGYDIYVTNFNFDFMVACYSLNAFVQSELEHQIKLINPDIYLESNIEIFGKGVKKNPNIDLNLKASYISKKSNILKENFNKLIEKLKETNTLKLYYKIDHLLIEVLYLAERQGISIDRQELKLQTNQILEKLQRLEIDMRDLLKGLIDKDFNFASPKQIQELLFEKLELPNLDKNTTSKEVLEKLLPFHPIVSMLLEHRKFSKLYSTYLKGFEKFIYDDNKIHTIFNHTLTNTGRLSSTDPNIQNISIQDEDQKQVRKIFVASKDKTFLSFDYSQIELRVLAQMSKEPVLIKTFNQQKDIHDQAARLIFNISESQSVLPEQRRMAKVFNFGILYGLTDYGLANDLNVDINSAKRMIEDYYRSFPGLLAFKQSQIDKAKQNKYALTLTNRKRNILELDSKQYLVRKFGERIAVNMPIQGTASDILKVAMISIFKELKAKNLDAVMIAQIHDEIILEVDLNQVPEVKEIVVRNMNSALKDMIAWLNIDDQAVISLQVSQSQAKTWYQLK